MSIIKPDKDKVEQVLYSHTWGTTGPVELSVAKKAAESVGGLYCVITHSVNSAINAALRALEPAYAQNIYVDEDPFLQGCVLSLGQTPRPTSEAASDEDIVLTKEAAGHGRQVLFCGSDLDKKPDFTGIYAAVYDFGIAGGVVTNSLQDYLAIFAYHCCGRTPQSEAASIDLDRGAILGGDMRITEWQAMAVEKMLEK